MIPEDATSVAKYMYRIKSFVGGDYYFVIKIQFETSVRVAELVTKFSLFKSFPLLNQSMLISSQFCHANTGGNRHTILQIFIYFIRNCAKIVANSAK